MTKRVYLFDETTGKYAGFWDAQESPLEPGVFITPISSTDIEPPAFTEEQTCTFNGVSWVLADI